MTRLDDILDKISAYNPKADLDLVRKAYLFSGMVHKGQLRLSGEPYMHHPIEVASLLADLRLDPATIATGLLHDTVEDTHTTLEKIEDVFGAEVRALVDGVTKISRISFDRKEDREAENFRKMLLAMASDIRVILVKLADRLHNMRTLDALSEEKRLKIARETIEIYAPLANRLGIGWMKVELEDLAFKYIEPEAFLALKAMTEDIGIERESYVSSVKKQLEERLVEHDIRGRVSGRPKHLYGIFRKMRDQDVEFNKIHDVIGFRIVVDSVKDCYAALGVVHSTWKPLPGRFKDYVAIPKHNLYQSLHTTVLGPYGERMEVQIRTEEMHRIAEYGIAAHWKYKEGGPLDDKALKNFAWLRQLLEWQQDLKDSGEFMETVKVDLFPEEVFVFTPKGDVKGFPVGASAIDFAYAIHTDIGHRCAGAKVDGKLVPIREELKNGNVVEIITAQDHRPSSDWLSFVVTSRAKNRIRQWLKNEERARSIQLGREICEKELARYGVDFGKLVQTGELDRIARETLGFQGAEQLQMNIGYGKTSVHQLLTRVVPHDVLEKRLEKKPSRFQQMLSKFKGKPERMAPGGVLVKGVDDVMMTFARCCNPLPGDAITGFISHGHGVTIHSSKCHNLMSIDPERKIEVEWDKGFKTTRPVKIQVICRNEKGLLALMSNAIMNADSNIRSAEIRTTPDDRAVNTFEVEVTGIKHLQSVMKALEKVKKVIKVERLME